MLFKRDPDGRGHNSNDEWISLAYDLPVNRHRMDGNKATLDQPERCIENEPGIIQCTVGAHMIWYQVVSLVQILLKRVCHLHASWRGGSLGKFRQGIECVGCTGNIGVNAGRIRVTRAVEAGFDVDGRPLPRPRTTEPPMDIKKSFLGLFIIEEMCIGARWK